MPSAAPHAVRSTLAAIRACSRSCAPHGTYARYGVVIMGQLDSTVGGTSRSEPHWSGYGHGEAGGCAVVLIHLAADEGVERRLGRIQCRRANGAGDTSVQASAESSEHGIVKLGLTHL